MNKQAYIVRGFSQRRMSDYIIVYVKRTTFARFWFYSTVGQNARWYNLLWQQRVYWNGWIWCAIQLYACNLQNSSKSVFFQLSCNIFFILHTFDSTCGFYRKSQTWGVIVHGSRCFGVRGMTSCCDGEQAFTLNNRGHRIHINHASNKRNQFVIRICQM